MEARKSLFNQKSMEAPQKNVANPRIRNALDKLGDKITNIVGDELVCPVTTSVCRSLSAKITDFLDSKHKQNHNELDTDDTE